MKRTAHVSVRVDSIETRIVARRRAALNLRSDSDYIRRLIREDGQRNPERNPPRVQ